MFENVVVDEVIIYKIAAILSFCILSIVGVLILWMEDKKIEKDKRRRNELINNHPPVDEDGNIAWEYEIFEEDGKMEISCKEEENYTRKIAESSYEIIEAQNNLMFKMWVFITVFITLNICLDYYLFTLEVIK